MRRRAEQSARDKARHAQKREELRLGRERERREQVRIHLHLVINHDH